MSAFTPTPLPTWDRIEQGLLAAVAGPETDQHRPVAGRVERDVTGPARGARRNGQVLCGTAQRHEDMVIVGIDHRGATAEIGKDRDTVFDRAKPPGLGVVPVRGPGSRNGSDRGSPVPWTGSGAARQPRPCGQPSTPCRSCSPRPHCPQPPRQHRRQALDPFSSPSRVPLGEDHQHLAVRQARSCTVRTVAGYAAAGKNIPLSFRADFRARRRRVADTNPNRDDRASQDAAAPAHGPTRAGCPIRRDQKADLSEHRPDG